MITIISATNRNNSMTRNVANAYLNQLTQLGIEAEIVDLTQVPSEALNDAMYRKGEHELRNFGHSIFDRSNAFILLSPEYNGSIPGILKLVIDACIPEIFTGKRFALAGVATGRAGNLRGMDHLTDIFHYLKSEVYSQKLPISQVRKLTDEQFQISDPLTLEAIGNHVKGYLAYLGLHTDKPEIIAD